MQSTMLRDLWLGWQNPFVSKQCPQITLFMTHSENGNLWNGSPKILSHLERSVLKCITVITWWLAFMLVASHLAYRYRWTCQLVRLNQPWEGVLVSRMPKFSSNSVISKEIHFKFLKAISIFRTPPHTPNSAFFSDLVLNKYLKCFFIILLYGLHAIIKSAIRSFYELPFFPHNFLLGSSVLLKLHKKFWPAHVQHMARMLSTLLPRWSQQRLCIIFLSLRSVYIKYMPAHDNCSYKLK